MATVYFLRSRKSEVDVVGVGSRTVRSTAVIDNLSLPRLADNEARIAGKGPLAAVRPLTRQQVVQNGIRLRRFAMAPHAGELRPRP